MGHKKLGPPVYNLINIKKTIGKEIILKGISLTIEPGEFVAITGPSGSGKSSLLYILGLLDKASEGKLLLLNKEIDFNNKVELYYLRNRTIGFVFQFHYLIPELTVLENLMLPQLKAGVTPERAKEKGLALLENFGLMEKAKRRVYELSGGEMQRVAIVRSVVNEPKILLCDEPTGNLDSENSRRVLNLLKSLNENLGTTVILVTHDLKLAMEAERVIEIKDGKIENMWEN